MDTDSQQAAGGPLVKPWEQADTSSGPTPFKPPSSGSTSSVVEASGTERPREIVSTADRNTAINRNALTWPLPNRPWEQQQNYGSTYGGYNSGLNYNSGYGSGMYGSSYRGLGGGLGGSYGGGLYGNNMYRGGYGGLYGGSSMYSGGMYNSGMGGPMGGFGVDMGPCGEQDPNNPYGGSPSLPGFWISFLRVLRKHTFFSLFL